jgi:hypothetical protein
MANLNNALQQLREERQNAQLQLEKLNSAISVLEELSGGSSTATRNGVRPKRVVSALARRRMAEAQRARWARVRGGPRSVQAGKSAGKAPARHVLSVAARRRIAAAQRARWARVRAQQASKAA